MGKKSRKASAGEGKKSGTACKRIAAAGSAGDVDYVINEMNSSRRDLTLVTAGLQALMKLVEDADDATKDLLEEKDAAAILTTALTEFPLSHELQHVGIQLLRDLCYSIHNVNRLVELGGLGCICRAICTTVCAKLADTALSGMLYLVEPEDEDGFLYYAQEFEAAGGAQVLTEVMSAHSTSEEIAAKACEVIAIVGCECRSSLGDAALCEAVVRALKMHSFSDWVVGHGLQAALRLMTDWVPEHDPATTSCSVRSPPVTVHTENAARLVEVGVVDAVHALGTRLQSHRERDTVCRILSCVATSGYVNEMLGVGSCEMLMAFIKQDADSESVVSSALSTLGAVVMVSCSESQQSDRELVEQAKGPPSKSSSSRSSTTTTTNNNDDAKRRIAKLLREKDLVNDIGKVMKTYLSCRVQEKACHLLGELAVFEQEHTEKGGESMLNWVSRALTMHPQCLMVQEEGVSAVYALAFDGNCSCVDLLNVCEPVINAMRVYDDDYAMQLICCMTIRNMCDGGFSSVRRRLGQLGCCTLIASGMATLVEGLAGKADDLPMAYCQAAAALAYEEDNIWRLLNAHISFSLYDFVRLSQRRPRVREEALWLIAMLLASSSPEMTDAVVPAFMDGAFLKLLTALLERRQGDGRGVFVAAKMVRFALRQAVLRQAVREWGVE